MLLGLMTLVVDMVAVGIVALVVAAVAGALTVVLGRRLAAVRAHVADLDGRVADLESRHADDEPTVETAADEGRLVAALDEPTADADHRSGSWFTAGWLRMSARSWRW